MPSRLAELSVLTHRARDMWGPRGQQREEGTRGWVEVSQEWVRFTQTPPRISLSPPSLGLSRKHGAESANRIQLKVTSVAGIRAAGLSPTVPLCVGIGRTQDRDGTGHVVRSHVSHMHMQQHITDHTAHRTHNTWTMKHTDHATKSNIIHSRHCP